MKRKLALLLTAVLAAGSIAGCSSSSSSESSAESAEPDHIIVTYLYSTTTPEDLEKVEDAVNEITITDINVEVEFKELGIGDSFTNYSLWISSGETVDLMMLAFQDVNTYTNSGQLEELDDLISEETTPTIYSLMEEYPIASTVGGVTYGISPVGINYGNQPGLIFREDWLTETGYEEKDIYTMEDLTEIFALVKANHEDSYPLGQLGSSISSGSSLFTLLYKNSDVVGDNIIAGVLMDVEDTEITNLFTSDEYKDYLQLLADWYNAGYILPDAATTDSSSSELLASGKIASYAMSQKPEQFNSSYSFEYASVPTDEAAIGAQSAVTNWVVPITSENPEAALRFLDYTFENHDLANLIMWGIEGEHFNIVDEDTGLIEFANGYDATTSPYYNTLGLWGDRRYEYTFDASATREDHEAFTARAKENTYVSYGFVFDSSDVSNEMLACQSVLDQYQKALETGTLGDAWEETYDTMVAALETAGIDTVIAACQEQLDEYLAE